MVTEGENDLRNTKATISEVLNSLLFRGSLLMNLFSQGFVTGGKDGVVGLWDQTYSRCLKTYKIARSSVRSGISSCSLLADSPPVRAISLGQGKILVGTTNSEVRVIA